MTVPINVIFGHLQVRKSVLISPVPCVFPSHGLLFLSSLLQKKTRVRIWLYEDTKTQLEGQIIGFDEYMNMVLDDAVEIGKKRTEIGRILLKGDSITLLQEANPQRKQVEHK